MDGKSRAVMNEYYSGLLEKHGANMRAVAYQTSAQQVKRYSALASVEPMDRLSSVLDVGCGLGHLCDYLRQHGWRGLYTGIDVNPDMISTAKQRLPEDELICGDILADEIGGGYDYVFCGATLQHKPKFAEPQEYMQRMVETMFSLTRRSLVFDVFSNRVDYERDVSLYVDPAALLSFCYGLTTRLALRNDLRPYELMVYLYKNVSIDNWNIYTSSATPDPIVV